MTTPSFYKTFEADLATEAECECCNGAFAPWATKLLIIQKASTLVVAHFCGCCAEAYVNSDPSVKITFIDKIE